jgi:hypothetical protein
MKSAVMEIVQQHFRPEFINRIDDIVVFHPLGTEQIRAIVDIQLGLCCASGSSSATWTSCSTTRRGTCSASGLRPGVRRAAAEACHPAADREPAGAEYPARASSAREIRKPAAKAAARKAPARPAARGKRR